MSTNNPSGPNNGPQYPPNGPKPGYTGQPGQFGPGGMPPGMPPYYYRPRQGRSVFSVLLILFLIACLGGSMMMNFIFGANMAISSSGSGKLVEKYVSHNDTGREKIAIITIDGTILNYQGFIKDQIDTVAKDRRVRGIVLRVNSPGGTITASDAIYHYLVKLTKKRKIPMVVSMGGLAASGGYYVSMAVGDTPDSIFAEPTTWTGSIGVKIPHFNLSKLMQNWGIQEDTIVSHELKNMGSFAVPMTEQERAIFQQLVNEGFDQFKAVIRVGRPALGKNTAKLDQLATGQIFTAQQALESGLIDKIGFQESAVERIIELAEVDPDKVKVVRYEKEPSFFSILSGSGGSSAELFMELASPKAYYLCTWLPDAIVPQKP
jgi:protease IV